MTDRELLELAAEAAGLVYDGYSSTATKLILWGGCDWSPLTDDGDALRLAVKLKITPHIDSSMTDCEDCTEAHLGDPYAATRRAIVRAAAEIGKAMK